MTQALVLPKPSDMYDVIHQRCQADTYAFWYPTGKVEDCRSCKLSHFPYASLSIIYTSKVLDMLHIDVVGLVETEKHD